MTHSHVKPFHTHTALKVKLYQLHSNTESSHSLFPHAFVCSTPQLKNVQTQLAEGFEIDLCMEDAAEDRNVDKNLVILTAALSDVWQSPAGRRRRFKDEETICCQGGFSDPVVQSTLCA